MEIFKGVFCMPVVRNADLWECRLANEGNFLALMISVDFSLTTTMSLTGLLLKSTVKQIYGINVYRVFLL